MLSAPAVLRVPFSAGFESSPASTARSRLVMAKTGAPRPGATSTGFRLLETPSNGSCDLEPSPSRERPDAHRASVQRRSPVWRSPLVLMAAACGSNPKFRSPRRSPRSAAGAGGARSGHAAPRLDPVAALIATSQEHFEAGERELKLGHLDRARVEFDRAVDVLLESPYGARTDARMREHFDRLIDRINAHEVTALAQGDGFAETKTEPASIDEILKIATFPTPDAEAATEEAVKADLARNRTTSRFRRTPRSSRPSSS